MKRNNEIASNELRDSLRDNVHDSDNVHDRLKKARTDTIIRYDLDEDQREILRNKRASNRKSSKLDTFLYNHFIFNKLNGTIAAQAEVLLSCNDTTIKALINSGEINFTYNELVNAAILFNNSDLYMTAAIRRLNELDFFTYLYNPKPEVAESTSSAVLAAIDKLSLITSYDYLYTLNNIINKTNNTQHIHTFCKKLCSLATRNTDFSNSWLFNALSSLSSTHSSRLSCKQPSYLYSPDYPSLTRMLLANYHNPSDKGFICYIAGLKCFNKDAVVSRTIDLCEDNNAHPLESLSEDHIGRIAQVLPSHVKNYIKANHEAFFNKMDEYKKLQVFRKLPPIEGGYGECAISLEPITHPYALVCGHVFDRSTIYDNPSPFTKCPLCKRSTKEPFTDTLVVYANGDRYQFNLV